VLSFSWLFAGGWRRHAPFRMERHAAARWRLRKAQNLAQAGRQQGRGLQFGATGLPLAEVVLDRQAAAARPLVQRAQRLDAGGIALILCEHREQSGLREWTEREPFDLAAMAREPRGRVAGESLLLRERGIVLNDARR
jgi:hypothetical protein